MYDACTGPYYVRDVFGLKRSRPVGEPGRVACGGCGRVGEDGTIPNRRRHINVGRNTVDDVNNANRVTIGGGRVGEHFDYENDVGMERNFGNDTNRSIHIGMYTARVF